MYGNYGKGLKNKISINPNFLKFKNNIKKDVQKQKYFDCLNTFNNTDIKLNKISLIKQTQNDNYNLRKLQSYQGKNQIKSVISKKGTNRLTQSNDIGNITNSFIFDNSYNETNDKFFIRKHYNNNVNNSLMKQKGRRHLSTNGKIISSENLSYDTYNPEMTVLINNGIIKNMFLNKKSAKSSYLKNKISQNINYKNAKNNSYVFQFHKPKMYKSLNERKSSCNTNNFNNKANFNLNKLNTTPNFENIDYGQISNEYLNKTKIKPKILIENFILNRNNYMSNKLSNMNYSVNNNNEKDIRKIQNNYDNYYGNSYKMNKSKKVRVDNNNIYKRKHFYHRTDMFNNDLNDNPIQPMKILYMKKYSYEPQKECKIIQYSNNNNKNKINRNQSYNNIKNKQIKNHNKNESLISSSTSSDNLSVLADEIMKINISKNSKHKINMNNSVNYDKKINNKIKVKSMNLSDIKVNKKRKIKSSVIPMNVNNFFISPIKPNDKNNDLNNKIKKNNKDLKSVINNNITLIQNKKIEPKDNAKSNINNEINIKKSESNIDSVYELKKNNKKEESELLNDDFLLIEQIMNEAEKEEKNKINRHIKFNLDDNIYINYNSNDLITKKIIYKKNEKMESKDDDKKMDIYYALLKSKTKFNPIIKKFEKDKIKINEDYELNENLEEYEILGDLYNVFFSKEINLLEHNIKKSIDVFMGNK